MERMAEIGRRYLPTVWREQLEQLITPEEEHIAVRKVRKKKAPGNDGFGWEFYKANWATIKDEMGELMNQKLLREKCHRNRNMGWLCACPRSANRQHWRIFDPSPS
jgi:hypothetical protein